MNKYLCLARQTPIETDSAVAIASFEPQPDLSFMQWQEKFADNIVDMGGRLCAHSTVVKGGKMFDGEKVSPALTFGGYMMLQAESPEQAAEVMSATPVAGGSMCFEICEMR